MAIYKNPFLSRFSDRTGLKSSSFLAMYAPQIIKELLNNEHLLMPKASWLVGIPGSGKSSILRFFSVDILCEILRQKITYLHLYEPLIDSNIIKDDSINIAGIYLQIDEIYAETANVKLVDIDNLKLFYTLFDLRVAKQLLNSLKVIHQQDGYSQENILIKKISSGKFPPDIFSEDYTFSRFENIIREKEQLISSVLTSFPGTPIPLSLELHNRFSSFDLIDAQQKYYDKKFILMVDDVHDLYPSQLKSLKEALEHRNPFPRWIATRKHIFPIEKLVGNSNGITDGRENIVIDIDNEIYSKRPLYKKFIRKLVERRIKLTSTLNEYNEEQIEGLLINESIVDESEVEQIFSHQKKELFETKNNSILSWHLKGFSFDEIDNCSHEDIEFALIKVHRILNKRQPSLFPEIDIDLENSASKDRQAALMFFRKKYDLPMYFGFDDIIEASNYNVEQFLRVFSPFVDRLNYRIEMDKKREIEPNEQFKILKSVAKYYTENVIPKLLYGRQICQLIDNLGRFFHYRTYEPNAPHAPGVTQFALTASDVDLLSEDSSHKSTKFNALSKMLTIAIANNVLVPEGSKRQGTKESEFKHVFSFNRLLCIHYLLPLQKGDFQLLSLSLLNEICLKPFKPEDIKSKKFNPQWKLWTE